MALRQVVLHHKRAALEEKMCGLEHTRDELQQKRTALDAEKDQAEAALNEITEETSAEDRAVVEQTADELCERDTALETEEKENETQRSDLQQQIDAINNELKEIENRAADALKTVRKAEPGFSVETRKEERNMEKRAFFGLGMQERAAFFADPEVKGWIPELRSMIKEKRDITNADLKIPKIALPILRQLTEQNSKLLPKVNHRRLNGEGRMVISGTIPEPVWTEMCGVLNEVSLSFDSVTVDGFKLGAYVPVCNALLDDAELAEDILRAFGIGMGFATDKAIAYGTGTGMPLGIVTRLTNTTAVSGRAQMSWTDVSGTQVQSTSKTKLSLFEDLITFSGALKSDYTNGETFWLMNNKTKTKLMVAALSVNAAGAIVTGLGSTMPVIGGDIVTREFMPDDVIVGGYGDMYLMSERAGVVIDESKHYRFIQDETVFKVTARYDGLPVIPEAFVAIGINGAEPTADAVTFPTDEANAAAAG